jgi:hypothetical protein
MHSSLGTKAGLKMVVVGKPYPMADLVLRTVFRPEVNISTLQLTSRRVWAVGASSAPAIATETLPKAIIRRPDGEPGKPNDGGFALKPILGWSHQTYNAVRVSV